MTEISIPQNTAEWYLFFSSISFKGYVIMALFFISAFLSALFSVVLPILYPSWKRMSKINFFILQIMTIGFFLSFVFFVPTLIPIIQILIVGFFMNFFFWLNLKLYKKRCGRADAREFYKKPLEERMTLSSRG